MIPGAHEKSAPDDTHTHMYVNNNIRAHIQ